MYKIIKSEKLNNETAERIYEVVLSDSEGIILSIHNLVGEQEYLSFFKGFNKDIVEDDVKITITLLGTRIISCSHNFTDKLQLVYQSSFVDFLSVPQEGLQV